MHKVCVIGSGGREHALSYRLSQSKIVDEVYCMPGNVGMKKHAKLVNIDINDFDAVVKFCKDTSISLVIVGPEVPLMKGIVDVLIANDIKVFGPTKKAAQLESSKAFAKDFMKRNKIQSANYELFDDYEKALEYLETQEYPLVIKASGLAQGKGVLICEDISQAKTALYEIMNDKIFGSSGDLVLIEEFMDGEEFSLFALCHNEQYVILPAVQDHKRAYDGDLGPNTGGMGVYMPVPFVNDAIIETTVKDIVQPTLKYMIEEDNPFTGVLFVGIMMHHGVPKVIEYNTRFGDPETEILMLAMESDLYSVIVDLLDDKKPSVKFSNDAFVGVVLAAKGYPNDPITHKAIPNLDDIASNIFHMGTTLDDDILVNSGGRALIFCNKGDTISDARDKAYKDLARLDSEDFFFRKDIGHKSLKI